ncbi:hypothetical protein EW146_g5023 [Bondarzewia mesenterica]|uniref:Carbohydrate kinase PfkB domain-containing protein n=1 Tax=Bondarzewia mesenterica TaxID=1095465 RepID=A0A4S4LSQ6_9AGAM|nr:hypothetical protein EW146_g5023 [Bondarzewia mesenterica]
MSRLRHSPSSLSQQSAPIQRPLRVIASGTLFLTHTLSLPTYPQPASNVRAHAYTRTRNGSACTVLSVLSQFRRPELGGGVEGCWLVASLGGNDEGKEVIRELDKIGVNTRYCKMWDDVGVPGAWVLHANDTDSQTVINHNPLPDISHEEFVSLLGPILAPENYPVSSAELSSSLPQPNPPPRPSLSAPTVGSPSSNTSQWQSPAPFDWLHFEGRSVKTTLNNIAGIDGLARERKWRSYCVFSIDVGRRARQGVEALIPHADVVFLNKHYAQAHSPAYASTPRAFLLSLTSIAPPHALLIAYWGTDGAAVLSVPTREYFQSSGWVEEWTVPAHPSPMSVRPEGAGRRSPEEILSVRSGSDFWAAPGTRRNSSTASAFSAALLGAEHSSASPSQGLASHGQSSRRHRRQDTRDEDDDSDADSQGTEIAGSSSGGAHITGNLHTKKEGPALDEVGAQDAFVAGMIYSLSRKILPGAPYSPGLAGAEGVAGDEVKRWRLDECLRFATELAGRKARRRGWDGLAEEMTRADNLKPTLHGVTSNGIDECASNVGVIIPKSRDFRSEAGFFEEADKGLKVSFDDRIG